MNLVSRIEKLEGTVFSDPDQPIYGIVIPLVELESQTPDDPNEHWQWIPSHGQPSVLIDCLCVECGENLNSADYSGPGYEVAYCKKCGVNRPYRVVEIAEKIT